MRILTALSRKKDFLFVSSVPVPSMMEEILSETLRSNNHNIIGVEQNMASSTFILVTYNIIMKLADAFKQHRMFCLMSLKNTNNNVFLWLFVV